MKDKYSTRKTTSAVAPEPSAEQCIRYARDVAAAGDLVDLRTFLDTQNATRALDSTLAAVSQGYSRSPGWLPHYAYQSGRQADAAVASSSATSPVDGATSTLVSTAGETVTNPVTALAPKALASSTVTTGTATTMVVPAESVLLTPTESGNAVGGGPSIATSLETAYSDSTSLQVDGVQAAALDAQRQIRGPREELVGSPRADR
ncbi:MAG: hypothetical protein JNK68_05745, partial [Betaproteobacteria bacterium]|nr:hypothetical protein [Betaproteobacteria bacterium]